MARLSSAPNRSRGKGRTVLWSCVVGAVLCAAAALMLALLRNGGGDEVQVTQVGPPPVAPTAVAPAQQPVIEPVATARPQPAAEQIAPPAAAPIAPPAAPFTVRVRPLANPGDLVAGVDVAQQFHARLVAQLRTIPNLVLVDAADASSVSVDYEVRVRLENSPAAVTEILGKLAQGMVTVLVDAGPPAKFAAADARLAAEAQMSPAEKQRAQRTRLMMRANAIVRNGLPMSVSLLDTSAMAPELAELRSASGSSGGDATESQAKQVVRMLRGEIFPVDAAYKQSTLATVRNRAEPFNVRSLALSDLLRLAHREGYATMDAEVIRAGAELAFGEPEKLMHTVVWEDMLATKHPELIPQIARALEVEPDTDLRLRLIKFLASDFAGNPAARKVLEAAARGNGPQLVRMAALREVQGEATWQAYVAASLVDTSLPDLQRLQAIADMGEPVSTPTTTRIVLDDKALRDLITLAGRVAADPVGGTKAFSAILALKSVDSPALADRLHDIVRAPMNDQTALTSSNSLSYKIAANGVAAVRFPDDVRFPAVLKELSASSDANLSDWAKQELEQRAAMATPESRKAYFDKLLQKIAPASAAPR